MRIVFCGSGDFGIPTVRALAGRGGHEIVGVLTQPPRPAGRGGKLRPTPAAGAAEELGLSVRAVEDINAAEVVAEVTGLGAEVMLVADFGQMIGRRARRAAALGAYNLHGSLLPELRGAAPVNWAILRGQQTTGVTTFRLVAKMDAGPVFVRRSTPIRPEETAEELRRRLADLGAEAVAETLDLLAAGRTEGEPQDRSAATFAPLLSKSDGVIDWTAEAAAIRNRIHGTWPWPGGQGRYVGPDGRKVSVTIARAAALDRPPDLAPGHIDADGTVAAGTGRVQIRELRPAGRRLMAWRDFANGYRAGPGARFETVGR